MFSSTFSLLAAVFSVFILLLKRRMRMPALFVLAVLLPGLGRSDEISLLGGGADFSFLSGTGSTLLSGTPGPDGMSFRVESWPSTRFISSNPLAPLVTNEDSFLQIETGPLVTSTSNSWTFGGGSFYRDAGVSVSIIPLPKGFTTCEADGFVTDPFQSGFCFFEPVVIGTLGDATFTLGDVIGYKDGGTLQNFDFTGTLAFNISADLARAEGISTGTYFGFFDLEGIYSSESPGFLGNVAGVETKNFNLTGTIPEPSSLILLLTTLAGMGAVVRYRARAKSGGRLDSHLQTPRS